VENANSPNPAVDVQSGKDVGRQLAGTEVVSLIREPVVMARVRVGATDYTAEGVSLLGSRRFSSPAFDYALPGRLVLGIRPQGSYADTIQHLRKKRGASYDGRSEIDI